MIGITSRKGSVASVHTGMFEFPDVDETPRMSSDTGNTGREESNVS